MLKEGKIAAINDADDGGTLVDFELNLNIPFEQPHARALNLAVDTLVTFVRITVNNQRIGVNVIRKDS